MALSSIAHRFQISAQRSGKLGREPESRNGGRIYPRIQSLGTSPAQHGSKLEDKSAQFVNPGTKAHERV
jgi:hypothetical protein